MTTPRAPNLTHSSGLTKTRSDFNGHYAAVNGSADEASFQHGIQVIDESCNFTDHLKNYLARERVLSSGFNYHVVSVFGSQSSGKSTLLNCLFGTNFDVMSDKERRQTTKGIWLSKSVTESPQGAPPMAPNILVLDVEGSDGRERGEDQEFERKAALFALTVSEVLMINVWENQVGTYTGANMALLKTVIEVNLRQFGADPARPRSLLLFVIRDVLAASDPSFDKVKSLGRTLVESLEKIWESIIQSTESKGLKFSDFFDLQFVGLPNKPFQPDLFDKQVHNLRGRFSLGGQYPTEAGVNDGSSTAFFLPKYHRGTPADGFPDYARNIWTVIQSNKDLNLPSQKELLAQFRCEEIAKAVTSEFDLKVGPVREEQDRAISAGEFRVIPNIGATISESRALALRDFTTEAGRYHEKVFEQKLKDLEISLDRQLKVIVHQQLKAAHKEGVDVFIQEVHKRIKTQQSSKANHDFASIIKEEKDTARTRFEDVGKDMLISGPDSTYLPWSRYDDALVLFSKDLDDRSAKLRAEQLDKLAKWAEGLVKTKVEEDVGLEFNKLGAHGGISNSDRDKGRGGKEIWDRIWAGFTSRVKDAEARFTERASSFDAQPDEIETGLWKLRRKSWSVLKKKVDEETMDGNLLLKLRENFEEKFQNDEMGIPRIWQPTDDIEGAYTKARDSTLLLIPLLSKFQVESATKDPPLAKWIGSGPESNDNDKFVNENPIGGIDSDSGIEKTLADELTVLNKSREEDIRARFRRDTERIFTDAKRSAIGGVAEIPLYFYGLLLALGWNELVAVLSSPMYFAFLILIGLFAYMTYSLNLWGPMLRMANAAGQQAVDISKDRLRDFLAVPDQNQPRRVAVPARSQPADIPLEPLDSDGRQKRH